MQERRPISSPNAPAAIGPYSQAIVHAGLVWCSGQVALDPAKGELVPGGIEEQTKQVLKNLGNVLSAAGSSLGHVLRTTVYLQRMDGTQTGSIDVAIGKARTAMAFKRPTKVFDELAKTTGQDPRLDAHVDRLKPQLDDFGTIQFRARKVAEDICLALQGSLLVRHGHPAVAEAFLATRLDGQWGGAYGTMPAGLDLAPILERAMVKG